MVWVGGREGGGYQDQVRLREGTHDRYSGAVRGGHLHNSRCPPYMLRLILSSALHL